MDRRPSASFDGLSSLSVPSSHDRRRRRVPLRSHSYHPGVSLKQARAAFTATPSRNETRVPAPRRHSGSSQRDRLPFLHPQVPLVVIEQPIPRVIVPKTEEEEDVQSLSTEAGDEIYQLLYEQLASDDGTTVALALERLGSIFKNGPVSKCHRAVQFGGPEKILEALPKWLQDDRVARHGCHAIFRMISTYTKQPPSEDDNPLDLVETFLNLDGATVVLHVLQSFPLSSEVQLYGMGAMGSLFQSRRGSTRVVGHRLVLEQGGVSVVAKGMQQFPHHAKLQEMGCWLLARLAFCLGKTHVPLFKVEGLVAAATSVQNHPQSPGVEKQAGHFMASVFSWAQKQAVK